MARLVRIEGLEETVKKLEAIRRGYAAEALRPIFLRGAETMARFIKAGAPRRTGRLERSIVARIARDRNAVVAFALSDVNSISGLKRDARGRPYRYPYIVEAGSPVHVIKPRKKGGLLKIGNRYAAYAIHPGFKPVRFFARGVARGRSVTRAQVMNDLKQIFTRAAA